MKHFQKQCDHTRASRRRGLTVLWLCVLLPMTAYSVRSVGQSNHDHTLLSEDRTLTLAQVLEATVTRYPTTVELAAQLDEASAWTERGQALFADSPSLSFRYQSDRWGSDNGLAEYESGIELPLWRWGERAATRTLGHSLTAESSSRGTALRWEVAGRVRDTLWNIALADNDLELAEAAQTIATRLTTSVERRHELGDVPMSDVILAQAAELETQRRIIEAKATMLDAEREYRSLTTLERRPAFIVETISVVKDIKADHPALVLVDAQLERAGAHRLLVEKSAQGNPTILIGPRRERGAFSSEFDNSVGLTITVPIGGSVHTRAETAATARAVAVARAERDRVKRALDLQMHEAAHGLWVVLENLEAAAKREKLAGRHYTMGLSAYQQGEIDLIDLLKIQETSLSATRQVTRLEIDQKRHTARYNQAVGELP